MDGKNLAYKASPAYFLRQNVLTLNPSIQAAEKDPRELRAGIQQFDIRPLPYPNAYELKFFMDQGQGLHFGDRQVGRGRRLADGAPVETIANAASQIVSVGVIWRPAKKEKHAAREAPIHAYWLPYEANRTHEMMLGSDANLFFTAGLSGCTVMVTGDPRRPRVAHINRDETGGADFEKIVVEPTRQQEALEKQRAKATGKSFKSRMPTPNKEELTSRQMMLQELKSAVEAKKSGRDNSNDVLGSCKWGKNYMSLAGVFGVRNAGTGIWKFYYQKYTNVGAPRGLEKLGFITRRDGKLMEMV